jgi:hypothetical protein|uniref:Uncharacterized protein n=1 Tax=Mimiviridae sp. ChoanoV1 TaxID=2596887 RepID=A0A5B8IQ50_9VIRU|nr:hypothetical protein 6_13 [Mimiviridae sp. ChoanoV1]
MNIHPLWLICILVRSILILVIRYFNNNKYLKNIFTFILALMGFGFIFKSLAGSNNEIQVKKVFWHETRLVHGILYILASYYLFNNNLNMNSIVLLTDLLFSLSYRFILRK